MLRNGITTACDCTRYGADIFSEVASRIGMRSLSGALANSPSLRAAGRPNWPLALDEIKRAIEPVARIRCAASMSARTRPTTARPSCCWR